MKHFFCIFFFFTYALFSEEPQEEISLVDQTKSPISRVAGSVNVISGTFVDQNTHTRLQGPDPYVVAHSYVSNGGDFGTLADCWDFFHPSSLVVEQANGLAFYHPLTSSPAFLCCREPGGGKLVFKGDEKASKFTPKLDKTGYLWMNSIDGPSRRDAKQIDIWRDSRGNYWTMRLGDGTIRVYESVEKSNSRPNIYGKEYKRKEYRIHEEALPSGNKRFFSYHRDKKLAEIQTKSSKGKLLHSVSFDWGDHHVAVTTSDKKTVRFSLDRPHDIWPAVSEIKRTGKPKLYYKYSKLKKVMVNEKSSSSGAIEKVVYFRKKGPFSNRVKELKTKLFAGGNFFVSHKFNYKIWKEFTRTRVTEVDGSRKTYFWDKQKRPVWVGCFSPEKKLLRAERFFWGSGDDEGRLVKRLLLDEERLPLVDKKFFFDKAGNVVEEKLRGSFTGRPHAPLTYDKNKEISGGEIIIREAKYDEKNRKISEAGPLGQKIYYEYEKNRDLVTAQFVCDGKKIIKREFFTYDDAAIKTEEIIDDGSSRNKSDMASVTKRIIKRLRPRRKMPRVGSPDEETVYIWTPKNGEKLFTRREFKHDSRGRTICERVLDTQNALARCYEYEYDDEDRVTRIKNTLIGTEESKTYDSAGRIATKRLSDKTICYTYDLLDRVVEEKTTFLDGSSASLCHEYDPSGRKEKIIDSRGRTTVKENDLISRVTKKVLPKLLTEEGERIGEETFFYKGLLKKHVLPTGACEEVKRSGFGKPLVTQNIYGAKTFYFYDLKARLIEQNDPSGLTTEYEYDALDRTTRITQRVGDKIFSEVTKRYNGFGVVEEIFLTKKISYTYDAYGRKSEETIQDLLTQQTVTKQFEYDTLHRVSRVIQKDVGIEERSTYDAADREIEKKVLASDGTVLSHVTKKYDASGKLIEEGVGRNGTIAKTVTTWGAFNLVSSIEQPDTTKMFFFYEPYHKAQDGNVYFKKTTTDPRGVTTEELLDGNDVPVFTTIKDPFGTIVARKKVFVSLLGKPTCIVEDIICNGEITGSVKTRLEYDRGGLLECATFAAGEKEEATWRYSYDNIGRKIEEKKPSGISLQTVYDEKGRVQEYKSSDGSISWKYAYNVQDLPESILNENSGYLTLRTYDGLGHTTKETFESGLSLQYETAATGLVSSITYPDNSKSFFSYNSGRLSSIERNEYVYTVSERDISGYIKKASLGAVGTLTLEADIMGRRTLMKHEAFCEERTKFDEIGLCVERTIDSVKETFSYDALSQLSSDNGRAERYDSLYRRVEHKGKKASHNARHQLLQDGEDAYSYNKDGCRVSDKRFSYTYDALDRLIALDNENNRIEYSYDAFHRRIFAKTFVKEESGLREIFRESYLWQGENEVGSVDASGVIQSLRVLGEGLGGDIGASVLFELHGVRYVPLHDIAGHVRVLLTLSGAVAERFEYSAFGREERTGSLSPWTFSSKREDASGFIYFGRRYYDMETGSWLTQDPLGSAAGPNLYAYVKNNPLMMFDLFGLVEESGGGIWDSVCNFCSSVCDMISGSSSSSGTSSESSSSTQCSQSTNCSTIEGPSQESSHSQSTVWRYEVGGGRVIYASRDENDRLVIHHDGKDFFEDNQGRDLGPGVLIFDNGLRTIQDKCDRIAHQTLSDHKGLAAFISMYNGTRGLGPDVFEAAKNASNIPTSVVSTSIMTLGEFFDKCDHYGIKMNAIRVGWSQGAAIGERRWAAPPFQETGRYSKFLGSRANFGPFLVSKDAVNYVVKWDPIPLLNPNNWGPLAVPGAFGRDVRWLDNAPGDDLHDFSNTAYKTAYDNFIEEQLRNG